MQRNPNVWISLHMSIDTSTVSAPDVLNNPARAFKSIATGIPQTVKPAENRSIFAFGFSIGIASSFLCFPARNRAKRSVMK